jgi:hypothetical protein
MKKTKKQLHFSEHVFIILNFPLSSISYSVLNHSSMVKDFLATKKVMFTNRNNQNSSMTINYEYDRQTNFSTYHQHYV